MQKTSTGLNVIGAIIMMVLLSLFIFRAIKNKPQINIVDGEYNNICCASIFINSGYIIQNEQRAPFELENMKFGLSGYVNRKFTKSMWQKTSEPTLLLFFSDGGAKAFTLTIEGQEYTFRKVASATTAMATSSASQAR